MKRVPRIVFEITSFIARRFYWYRHHLIAATVSFLLAYLAAILVLKVILKPIAIKELENILSTRVEIDSADFTSLSLVKLAGLKIYPEANFTDQRPILRAEKVSTDFGLFSLLRFKPQLKKIKISGCDIDIIYCIDENIWNIAGLKLDSSKTASGILPKVELENITTNYYQNTDDKNVLIGSLPISFAAAEYIKGSSNYGIYISINEQEGFGSGRIYGSANIAKSLTKIKLDGDIEMNVPVLQGNQWDMENIKFEAALTDKDFTINHFSFRLGNGASLVLSAGLSLQPKNPLFWLKTDIKNVYISDISQRNYFIYSSELFSPISKRLDKFFSEYKPQGKYNLNADISGTFLDLRKSKRQVIIDCLGGSAIFDKFPYQLNNLDGQIEIVDDVIVVPNLHAEHNQTKVIIKSHCICKPDNDNDIKLSITTDDIQLDDDLYYALPEDAKRLWFLFAPSGNGKGVYSFEKNQDGMKAAIDFEQISGQAAFEYFPYPLKNASGTLRYENDSLFVENVVARNNQTIIGIDGSAVKLKSDEPVIDFLIDAENVAIDSNFISAMPRHLSQNFEDLKMQGSPSAKIHFLSNSINLSDYKIQAEISADKVSLFEPSLDFNNIKMSARLNAEKLTIDSFQADMGQGSAQLTGQVMLGSSETDNHLYSLKLQAENITVNENLFAAASPKAHNFYEKLKLSGKIDLQADLSNDANLKEKSQIIVDCRNVRAMPEFLPLGINSITGNINIIGDKIKFENIKGVFANSILSEPNSYDFSMDGIVFAEPNEPIKADIKFNIVNMLLNEDLTAVLPKQLGSVYSKLSPRGVISAGSDRLTFTINSTDLENLETTVKIRTIDAAIKDNTATNINADLLAELKIENNNVSKLNVALNAQEFKIKEYSMQSLNADFEFDSVNQKFFSRNISVQFYDGLMTGELTADFGKEDIVLGGNFGFDGVDIEKLCIDEPNEIELSKYLTGKLSGSAAFEIEPIQKQTKFARFIFQVQDVAVAEKSLIGKILSAIGFKSVSDTKFNYVKFDGHLDDKILSIDKLDMHSDDVSLSGAGSYNIANKMINLKFSVLDSRKKNLNLFESLQRATSDILISVSISGTLVNPQIKTEPLPFMQDIFNILGTK